MRKNFAEADLLLVEAAVAQEGAKAVAEARVATVQAVDQQASRQVEDLHYWAPAE